MHTASSAVLIKEKTIK